MNGAEINLGFKQTLGDKINFIGVYCSDQLKDIVIPKVNKVGCVFIANTLTTDDNENKMGHWVAFYIKKNISIFFDSFGLNPKVYCEGFRRFVDYSSSEWFRFSIQLQPLISVKCGLYVLTFIHYLSYNGMERTLHFVKGFFSSKNHIRNDKLVTRYYFRYIYGKSGCQLWDDDLGKKRAITLKECRSLIKLKKVMVRFFISME